MRALATRTRVFAAERSGGEPGPAEPGDQAGLRRCSSRKAAKRLPPARRSPSSWQTLPATLTLASLARARHAALDRLNPPAPRRNLAIGVAANLPAEQSYELRDLDLIAPGDLSWLLDELPAMPPSAQEPLARCVPQLTVEPTAGEADLILGMQKNHPAYPFT